LLQTKNIFTMTKMIHSYWAYLVLLILIIAVLNAIIGLTSKKEFKAKDLRISLFALITAHIQLILGFVAYYFSVYYDTMKNVGMGEVMKNSELRKPLIEHPLLILIAIALITIGFSKHKKKSDDAAKFKTIAIFYTIALILILAVIPWNLWFSNL
jgi:heme/copper-type cytochrome/quinol oxidase subunit 2